jgi:hypothetical protein
MPVIGRPAGSLSLVVAGVVVIIGAAGVDLGVGVFVWVERKFASRPLAERCAGHDLRHSRASLAVSAGVNVLALARMLGHKDPSVTLRVYSDLFDSDLDAVAVTLHANYSRQSVLNSCSRALTTTAERTEYSGLPAQIPESHQCGRRDSNPQALSSTGT